MMTDAHKWPRLFVAEDLRANTTIALAPEPSHYLSHVLRLRQNDPVRLFNARDGEWLSRVAAEPAKKRGLTLALQKQLRPQLTEPDLWLCCAPIKRAHFDFMMMKATELGVAHIQPILTDRTQVREVNADRSRAIAIEAAEQSERLSIPIIHPPIALDHMAIHGPAGRLPIVCAEFGEAMPIGLAMRPFGATPPAAAAVITGPEGGFTPSEMQQLRQIPNALPLRLGPRILRADTAALAALSCWQALCGDWR